MKTTTKHFSAPEMAGSTGILPANDGETRRQDAGAPRIGAHEMMPPTAFCLWLVR